MEEVVTVLLRLFFSFGGESFSVSSSYIREKPKRHQRTSRYTLYRFDSADVVYIHSFQFSALRFRMMILFRSFNSSPSVSVHNIHQCTSTTTIYLSIYYYIALASCAACSSPLLLLLLNGYTYKSDRFLF